MRGREDSLVDLPCACVWGNRFVSDRWRGRGRKFKIACVTSRASAISVVVRTLMLYMTLMIIDGKITIEEQSGRTLTGYFWQLDESARKELETLQIKITVDSICHFSQWSLVRDVEDCIIDNICWRDLCATMRCLNWLGSIALRPSALWVGESWLLTGGKYV